MTLLFYYSIMFLVFIHSYMDGNGRMGRFLMNAMLASGGYPWTIIQLSGREPYMTALEEASVHGRIKPFTEFVRGEIKCSQKWIRNTRLPSKAKTMLSYFIPTRKTAAIGLSAYLFPSAPLGATQLKKPSL